MDKSKKKVFLLGGADLEMQTIKAVLQKTDCLIVDKCLTWDCASVCAYSDELNLYSSEAYEIYGIELNQDGASVPENYTRIDHHNDLGHLRSALEQVADILNYQLSEQEELIAENDKGSYLAMDKYLSAKYPQMSGEEKSSIMNDIRQKDRNAQGVSANDELIAEKIVSEKKYYTNSFFVFVDAGELNCYSPLVDRLWPYDRLVVYNDSESNTELCFYGRDASAVLNRVKMEFSGRLKDKPDVIYSGGGENGYWGIKKNSLSVELIDEIVLYIKSLRMGASCHTFYFPFEWNMNEKLQGELKNLKEKGNWTRVCELPDSAVEYNERNFFYQHVHDKIFDDQKSEVSCFTRNKDVDARYVIEVEVKSSDETKTYKYDLKIQSIDIKLYATGVGLIAYNLVNDSDATSPDDILRINQYGRRVFPPFYNDINDHIETAKSISIVGLTEDPIVENFESYKSDSVSKCWKAGKIVHELITDFDPLLTYKPVIDDRMFVMSCYVNTELAGSVAKYYPSCKDFWYRYIFVDASWPMCQDTEMRNQLIKDHTYRRWADYGTLYGITRYSMVLLLTEYAPLHIISTLFTSYARMVELVLMQRASVLKFSKEVNNINQLSPIKERTKLYDSTAELCRNYIKFKNQFFFKEVTAQEQGIELYDMLQATQRVDVMVSDMDNDIQELYQYNTILEERETNRSASTLNLILGVFTPAAFFVSLFSYDQFLSMGGHVERAKLMGLSIGLGILILIVLIIIYNTLIKPNIERFIKPLIRKIIK